MNTNMPFPSRLSFLWFQSYQEVGVAEVDAPKHKGETKICLFPRSYVEKLRNLGFEKTRDFNFRGAIYSNPVMESARQWLFPFAKQNFTSRSYFQVTDSGARRRSRKTLYLKRTHSILGDYDHTFRESGFVPRERPTTQSGHFDEDFFRIMCGSEFTLCPAGDGPWSMRFYEAILSKSIPIVKAHQHAGRNQLEYDIGYKYYLADDVGKRFRPDWAEENFNKFIEYQTLIPPSEL